LQAIYLEKNNANILNAAPLTFLKTTEEKKMKDRTIPCIYYVCKDADCKKGIVKVQELFCEKNRPGECSPGLSLCNKKFG